MRYLTLILVVLLAGCADHITETQPIYEITETEHGSICEFGMTANGRKLNYTCPCPDTIKAGDQVVLQFVRP